MTDAEADDDTERMSEKDRTKLAEALAPTVHTKTSCRRRVAVAELAAVSVRA